MTPIEKAIERIENRFEEIDKLFIYREILKILKEEAESPCERCRECGEITHVLEMYPYKMGNMICRKCKDLSESKETEAIDG